MIYSIEKPPENCFYLDEEWGYRMYFWIDENNIYDPNKAYYKLSGVSKRNFPGTLWDIEAIIFKTEGSSNVRVIGDDSYKVDEEQLKSVAYIVKTDEGIKAYCGSNITMIAVDTE